MYDIESALTLLRSRLLCFSSKVYVYNLKILSHIKSFYVMKKYKSIASIYLSLSIKGCFLF